jgi:hypothetical protein
MPSSKRRKFGAIYADPLPQLEREGHREQRRFGGGLAGAASHLATSAGVHLGHFNFTAKLFV